MADEQVMKFESGAERTVKTGKGRYDLIPPWALKRLARVYEVGGLMRGDRNWEKGIPFSRCLDSVLRHTEQYLAGDESEDHLAQAAFWLFAVMHFECADWSSQAEFDKVCDVGPNAVNETGPVIIPSPCGHKDFPAMTAEQFTKGTPTASTPTNASNQADSAVARMRTLFPPPGPFWGKSLIGRPDKVDVYGEWLKSITTGSAALCAKPSVWPPRVYVSGPLSSDDSAIREDNIKRASDVAKVLLNKGFRVICPHTMSDTWDKAVPRETMMQNDFDIIANWATHVYVVPPSYSSVVPSAGTVREVAYAKAHKINVVDNPGDCRCGTCIRVWAAIWADRLIEEHANAKK